MNLKELNTYNDLSGYIFFDILIFTIVHIVIK